MAEYERSEKLEMFAKEHLEKNPRLAELAADGVKVVCITSTEGKTDSRKHIIYAETEKISEKYKWATGEADVMIIVYLPNISYFNDAQKSILILNELLRIETRRDKNGEQKILIKDYDLHCFRYIADKYGSDWDIKGLF